MHVGRGERARSSPRREPPWSSFVLFAETLFTGVLVAAASMLLVTFVPAMAAGTSRLRRHLNGEADTVAVFASDFRGAWRTLWPLAIGAPVLAGLLVVNTFLVGGGDVPGGGALAAVMAVLALTVIVVTLRAAAMWRPAATSVSAGYSQGQRRPAPAIWAPVTEAGQRSARDPVGTILVVAAVGMCVVLTWMLLPLVAVAPGLLALALVAVELRHHSRQS